MFRALVNVLANLLAAVFFPSRASQVRTQTQRKNFSTEELRADDLLVLRLDFYNLRLQPVSSGKQIVADSVGDSFIIVHFPPQHIAERAFDEGDPLDSLLPPPVAARLAGESRLVFYLNSDLLPLSGFSLISFARYAESAFQNSVPSKERVRAA